MTKKEIRALAERLFVQAMDDVPTEYAVLPRHEGKTFPRCVEERAMWAMRAAKLFAEFTLDKEEERGESCSKK